MYISEAEVLDLIREPATPSKVTDMTAVFRLEALEALDVIDQHTDTVDVRREVLE
jgi:hypothetical protein